jgi:glyoxylase-like metal-dependent hydrolase (beta-lactamase superfamily II)
MYATKVSERIYLLDTFALGQAKLVGAYAIKGPKVTLVDCGYASSYRNVLAGLSEIGVSPSDVRYLIPTHVHLDHAGAAGHLLREMPNAKMIAHERGVPHLIDPTRLVESATEVFGGQVMEMYGKPLPVPADRITAVGEETRLDLGDQLTANLVHSPGHAPHQLSVSIEGMKMLITADAVGIVYPGLNTLIPTTPPPSFNPASLVSTVTTLEQTDPGRLLVPHFGAREDVGHVFEDTQVKVQLWVKEVRELKNQKLGLDEISEVMIAKVKSEARVDYVPIHAQVSVRTSVMGILHYLDKNP